VQDGEIRVESGESANSLLLEYSDAREGLSSETVRFGEGRVPSATFEQEGERYVVSFPSSRLRGMSLSHENNHTRGRQIA